MKDKRKVLALKWSSCKIVSIGKTVYHTGDIVVTIVWEQPNGERFTSTYHADSEQHADGYIEYVTKR